MGKNSQTDFNSTKQVTSVSKINIHKSKNKKSNRKKRKSNIKRLFDQLRNESDSISTSSDNTVVEIDDTVIEAPNNNNSKETNSNLIVINDDEDIVNQGSCSYKNIPLQSSTPIPSRRRIHQNTPISPVSLDSPNKINEDIINLTKEINGDSYLTIDLTNDSLNTTNESKINTVIDLRNTSGNSHRSLSSLTSISGESDVTCIKTKRKGNKEMRRFANGIAKLDSSERGKLLELIAKKIFKGCSPSLHSLKNGINRSTETVEDTYIKEVILGQAASRNSIGSNIYNPEKDVNNKKGPRMIVIDGSNVAMQHTNGRIFSVKGLKICIDYFLQRGHVVKAFVPRFRCKYGKSTDGRLLDHLERQGYVVYTPSREIQGRMITSYDDRYIVQCAAEFDGVIVSGDNYRDLLNENPRWRFIIENRLLQFTWVGDMIMFPKDPLGRNGPLLQNFLRHPE